EVIDLPGCVSQGETLEELQGNIKEAIEAVLQETTEAEQITMLTPTPPSPDISQFVILDEETARSWAVDEKGTKTVTATV
ncbi:MAG: type II toxin-antitoxin system HicB family antitoxin, partial [Dehalococcoidia bacterium]